MIANEFAVDHEFGPITFPSSRPFRHRVAMGRIDDGVLRSERFRPVIVFGPQRSGKTTGVVIPAVLEWDGPCLATSVRLDVVVGTIEQRNRRGRTYIFDPAGTVEASEPELLQHCVGWSPLDNLYSWDDAVRRSHGLAEGAGITDVSNDQFWNSQARLLLNPLLFAAARINAGMGELLDWLGQPAATLMGLIQARSGVQAALAPTGGWVSDWDRCFRQLQSFASYADTTYSSICATALTMLEVFRYSEVERRCSIGGLQLEDFLDGEANTLYVCAPPDEQQRFRPLFTALVREVMTLARRRNERASREQHRDQNWPVPLMLCLDEAGNIARLDDLDTIATTAAGSGIQLVSVFHDMSQLKAAYGPDRSQLILNNHSGKLFLPGNSDPRTNDFLVTVLSRSQVRRLPHYGWSFADLRELRETDVLCIYGRLPPLLADMRRSFDDPDLLAASSVEPDQSDGNSG